MPHLKMKGSADIFVFSNLDAGNIGYKIAERLEQYYGCWTNDFRFKSSC